MRKSIVLAVMGVLVAAVSAQAGDWQKLGAKTIWENATSEVVMVKGAPSVGQLQVKVTGKPVKIQNVKVFFVDGGSQDLAVNQSVQPGFTTTALALDGGAKAVERVEMTLILLDTQSRRAATVTVLGS
jgi:hypothetical protein